MNFPIRAASPTSPRRPWSAREDIARRVKQYGGGLVVEGWLGRDARDRSAVLGKARAANPDVVLHHLHSGPPALVIRQAAATNLNIRMVAGSAMHQPSTA